MKPSETLVPTPGSPVLVTMGDPAGIGPEIIALAVRERPTLLEHLVVAGDVETMRRATHIAAQQVKPTLPTPIAELTQLSQWRQTPPGCLAVVQACHAPVDVAWGQVSAVAGRAAAECIRFGAEAALRKEVVALVTAPVHKKALASAGVQHPGHTEMLQSIAAEHQGTSPDQLPVRMMLSCPGLRTVLVSIHVALREALAAVSFEQVAETIRLTHAHFQRCGFAKPRIAVAGLNPHAGEGGLFGREEIDVIAPVIGQAQGEGIDATGPHAPDTVFMRARQGDFDVVIAMYHDQGLIPVKLLGLDDGVNTTIGLPFVRTSPDHGTAMDLAGTGTASPLSLLAAIDAAMGASTH
ncbi:4-hydroxythreonine-4-phosphate dehydrogenase [Hydrogenophaga palleronii]|uniref:4-hydroxythreonine-4-phosphate dehydrogenase n=1 Tax=Hydrogenophaga palleronii TaxID=65655 RepID=A0ABU1WQ35_9BURK|nr:4-hydroxythreonine-4-phosphate dehydrogenase PdxA [Hydrogenophaga palleronii]MDR7151081.1 4-hydroxythreonine-4-phosphate dehydrogenase [Hydrogenophaga palleronii]